MDDPDDPGDWLGLGASARRRAYERARELRTRLARASFVVIEGGRAGEAADGDTDGNRPRPVPPADAEGRD